MCVCVCHGNAPISKAFWKVVWPAARARPDSAIYPSSNNSLSGHKSGLNLNHQCDSSQPVRWGSTSSHARYMLGLCAVCANRLKHTSPVEVPRLVPKSRSKGTKEAKKPASGIPAGFIALQVVIPVLGSSDLPSSLPHNHDLKAGTGHNVLPNEHKAA